MSAVTIATWTPPSRRAQVAGAVGILLVAGFWGLLLPFANSQVEGANPFKAGVPYDLGGVTIVPADEWQLGASVAGLFTSIEKGSTSLGVPPAAEGSGSVEEILQPLAATLQADSTIPWQVGEPELFTADDGTPAGRLVAQSPNAVDITYVISDGTRSATFGTRTDPASWKSLEAEIDAMGRSMVLTEQATGTVTR
jgi:hypothetical protein